MKDFFKVIMRCRMNKFSYNKDIYVISFPKSGRTWLRVMLDRLNIELSYSHDETSHTERISYKDLSRNKDKYRNKKIIFLVRDPRDTVVSGYFQAVKRIKVYNKPISEFIRDERHGIRKILEFHYIWFNNRQFQKDFLSIRYEDMHGLLFDKFYLQQLPKDELEKRIAVYNKFLNSASDEEQDIHMKAHQLLVTDSSNKHLLAYLVRELNWITISILSASYTSALVLLRSVFELLVGIATKTTGPMAERIESMKFLSYEEQKEIKKLWRKLCGWGHPYKKWEKDICPIFIAHTPLYHPQLCKECIKQFETIMGLFLTVALDKFEIKKKDLRKRVDRFDIDLSDFPILKNRI